MTATLACNTRPTTFSLLYRQIALAVPLFAAFLRVINLKLKASISVATFGLLKLAAKSEKRKFLKKQISSYSF